MGSSYSTPPPLVQVSAPRGKVLVPPGTVFTVQPSPSYTRSRFDPYTRGANGPVYTPYAGGRARARRGCNNPRHRYGVEGRDIDIAGETSEDNETMTADMKTDDGMRRRKGKTKGNPISMDAIGQAGTSEQLDTLDASPRSAPEMPGIGGYAGMPMRMSANGVVWMQQPSGMTPEYTSNPNLAGYGGDGMVAGPGIIDTCSSYPGPWPSPLSSNGRPSHQPVPRRRPNHYNYEHVPMGAYTDVKRAKKSPESYVDQQMSTQGNNGQASGKKVGPRSHKWLDGDAFLDACTCTTNCQCRKGQRVLYRARDSRQKAGSEPDGEQHEYMSGEIRYILKDDVGRDCGDHNRCWKSKGNGDEEDERGRKKKEQKEGKKLNRQLQSFKDELLEALDERFDDMRKGGRQSEGQSPARPSLGASRLGQGAYTMVNGAPRLDARMASQTGMRNYARHGVVRPEIGLMPHGVSGSAAAGMRGHQHDDVPDMDDGGHDSDSMGKRQATEPNSTSRYGARAGRPQAMCYSHTPGGRGGMFERHRRRRPGRRRV